MYKDKFLILLVIILLIVVFSLSCNNVIVSQTSSSPIGSQSSTSPPIETQLSPSSTLKTPAKLIGTDWVVISVNGTKLDQDTSISLNFSDGGSFRGDVICNYYGGKYTTNGDNTLKMTDVTLTLLLCNEGDQTQANDYLLILSSVLSYKINQNYLVLKGEDDKELVILQSS
jgi:heat shock protein HslJ